MAIGALADGYVITAIGASSKIGAWDEGTPLLTAMLKAYPAAGGDVVGQVVMFTVERAAQLVAAVERAATAAGFGEQYTAALDQQRADLAAFYATHEDPEFTVREEE